MYDFYKNKKLFSVILIFGPDTGVFGFGKLKKVIQHNIHSNYLTFVLIKKNIRTSPWLLCVSIFLFDNTILHTV